MQRILLGSAVSVALLTGCGGDEDQGSPVDTVRAFYDAVGTGDGETACDLVTERYVRQLEYDNPSCEAILGEGGFGARAEEARVTEVERQGGRAIVTTRRPLRGERRDVHACVIRQGDEWLIDGFDARSRPHLAACRRRPPTS